MSRAKPLHRQTADFCKYHLGKDCFAPFTGQDHPTWNAFVYLLECYSHGGGEVALKALKTTLRAAQPMEGVLRVFVQAIPGVLDWSDVARLWPTISDGVSVVNLDREARFLWAVERSEIVRAGKVETRMWRHGLGVQATAFDVQIAGGAA